MLGPMTRLSPIVSPFATVARAQAHDRWARAKIEAALADRRPAIAHDKVMAEMRRLIAGFVVD
jgi:hypothetical protein